MEGVNLGGILLGYLAVLVFGAGLLVALALWIARQARAARFALAAGFLLAGVISALVALSFLQGEYRHGIDLTYLILDAGSLLVAGIGPFVAAFRGPRTYAATLALALGAVAVLTLPFLDSDSGQALVGGVNLHLGDHLVALAAVSLSLALAGLVIAVLPPYGARPTAPAAR